MYKTNGIVKITPLPSANRCQRDGEGCHNVSKHCKTIPAIVAFGPDNESIIRPFLNPTYSSQPESLPRCCGRVCRTLSSPQDVNNHQKMPCQGRAHEVGAEEAALSRNTRLERVADTPDTASFSVNNIMSVW